MRKIFTLVALLSAFVMVPNVAYSAGREDRPRAGARTVNGIVEEPMVYDGLDHTRLKRIFVH